MASGRPDAVGGGQMNLRFTVMFLAGMLLATGCAIEPDTATTGSVSSEEAASEASVDELRLEHCENVETAASGLQGSLGARQNPDAIMEVLGSYRDEHTATYGGRWIDRDNRVVVVAFTDDPDAHRKAILALLPSADDVMIDIVQVRYAKAELEAIQGQVIGAVAGRDFAESMFLTVSITQNRVSIDLLNPPEGTLDELAELVPDPGAVCILVFYTPEPPSGPLRVIPDLEVEDPLVTCRGIPPVRYSQLIDPPSIDHVTHPAVEALRAELDAPGPEPLAQGSWVVISIDEDQATFAVLLPDEFGYSQFKRSADRWRLSGYGLGPPCESTVALPEGLGRVEVSIDPGSLPSSHSTTIQLLVTEVDCASGREMGDALMGPQVVETEAAVLVAFAAIPLSDRMVTCQGNPSTPVTIELSRPLGDRTIRDGVYVPPKLLQPTTVDR